MRKILLILFIINGFTACKEETTNKDGLPNDIGAREIIKKWFEELKESVGGISYEPESYEVVSVEGEANKATIIFKWKGLVYPPSVPDSDQSPSKVTDKMQTLHVVKKDNKWSVERAE